MYTNETSLPSPSSLPVRWIVANIFNRPLHSTESPFPRSCAVQTATHFQELNALVLLTYLATVSFLIHVVPTCLPTSAGTFVFQCHSVSVPAFATAHVAGILLSEMYRRPFPLGGTTHSVNRKTVLVSGAEIKYADPE